MTAGRAAPAGCLPELAEAQRAAVHRGVMLRILSEANARISAGGAATSPRLR